MSRIIWEDGSTYKHDWRMKFIEFYAIQKGKISPEIEKSKQNAAVENETT